MDNELAKYLNQEDLFQKVVKACRVVQGTARDSGNVYYCLEIEFVNGFKKRLFPNDAEKFALASAYEYLQTSKQVSLDSEPRF